MAPETPCQTLAASFRSPNDPVGGLTHFMAWTGVPAEPFCLIIHKRGSPAWQVSLGWKGETKCLNLSDDWLAHCDTLNSPETLLFISSVPDWQPVTE